LLPPPTPAFVITRGQISLVPEQPTPALRVPVCRDGYITPAMRGMHCVGASYHIGRNDIALRLEDHRGNLERLGRLLPGFASHITPQALNGRVGFRTVTVDRMPVVGEWAPQTDSVSPQLFACLALASRGLTWAPLLGETVACMAAGEPLPLQRDLLRALAPALLTVPLQHTS
jgi:tRNA 5-methylaminomethyl-2-thiouridine biosynthesis bifunctional protein